MIDLNGAAAYRRAGYKVTSDAAASAHASRLVANGKITAAVAAARNRQSKRTEITADYVLTRLQENLERSMQAVPVLDREGTPTGEYTYQGAVANRALELLGKYLGLFQDSLTVKGDKRNPLVVTVEELEAAKRGLEGWRRERFRPIPSGN